MNRMAERSWSWKAGQRRIREKASKRANGLPMTMERDQAGKLASPKANLRTTCCSREPGGAPVAGSQTLSASKSRFESAA
jgi:hypothetical protein